MSFFKSIGTNVARAKQQAMVKIGQSEGTVDPEFTQLEADFKEIFSKMRRLGREVQNYQNAVKDLGAAQNGMAQMILDQYDQSDRMYQAAVQFKEISNKEIESHRQRMEQYVNENFHQPLGMYLGQYKMIDERITERNTRAVDKDRYNSDLKSLISKPDTDPTRLQIAKEKAEYKSKAYEDLNDELKRDIPRLLQDRARFFDALFANLVQAEVQYLVDSARALGLLESNFDGINRIAVRTWQYVVTEPSMSHHGGSNPTPLPGATSQQQQQQQKPVLQTQQQKPVLQTSAGAARARALYPFQGQDHTELTFQPADIITVYRQGGDWWEGELNGRRGLFPAAYVQII